MARIVPGQGGYLVLFVLLVTLLVLGPMLHAVVGYRWVLQALVTAVLLGCVWAVVRRRRQVVILILLLLASQIDAWAGATGSAWLGKPVQSLLAMVLLGWVAVILAWDIFTRRTTINADVIIGGINVYLLIGVAFAYGHLSVAQGFDGAYQGLGAGASIQESIYFSFVTLTTLGYGDIQPIHAVARTLAYSEAVMGQLFIAVLLARLVAMRLSSPNGGPVDRA